MPLPYPTNPNLQAVPVYQPGRPIEEVARELGLPADGIIKVSSNENPLGLLVKCGVRNAEWQGVRRQIGPAHPVKRVSGTGNWDQPNHTTCSGRPLSTNPTYSAFWSVFGVTCLRLQRLASSVGFGTTARLAPRKNLPYSGVRPEP
jgi:hypothetical protein